MNSDCFVVSSSTSWIGDTCLDVYVLVTDSVGKGLEILLDESLMFIDLVEDVGEGPLGLET